MKKIITILGITLLGFIVVNAILSLTSSEIKKFNDKGYISSDNFTTFDECNTTKERYNTEYPSYKRSECFSDGEGYKYFICQLSDSCSIIGTESSMNRASLTSDTISIQYKIDKYLETLKAEKSNYTNNADYVKMLDEKIDGLETLKKIKKYNNYTSTINYLINGINQITLDEEEEDFICGLTGTCDNSVVNSSNNNNISISTTNSNGLNTSSSRWRGYKELPPTGPYSTKNCSNQVNDGDICDAGNDGDCLGNGIYIYFKCITPTEEYFGKIIDEQGNGVQGVTLDFGFGGDVSGGSTITDSNGNWYIKENFYARNTSPTFAYLHNKPGYYRGDMTINTNGKQPDFTLTKLKPLYIIPSILEIVRQKNISAQFDLNNYSYENDVLYADGGSNLQFCVSITQNPCSDFVDLKNYQALSNGFRVLGLSNKTNKFTIDYTGFIPENVKTAYVGIRRKNDNNIAIIEIQLKEASFTWNQLLPIFNSSGLYTKPIPSDIAPCPSNISNGLSCNYLQQGSQCVLDFNATSYKEFSCEIINTTPKPNPTAKITVNGGKKDITVNAGDMVEKTWNSTNGVSYDAVWSAAGTCADNGKINQHWNGLDGLVSPNTKANGTSSYPASAIQEGCNYVITYKVISSNGQTASDYIIIRHPKSTTTNNITYNYSKTTLTSLSDSLTFTVSGLDYDNAQGCLTVLTHPISSAISPSTACTEPSQFTYFKNNPNWSFNHTTKVWTQTWSYARTPSVFTSGVSVQTHFRNTITGEKVDGKVVTVSGLEGSASNSGYWIKEGFLEVSPPPPNCNSDVAVGKNCTIGNICSVSTGTYRCIKY